ncbi:hypothetical protein BMS3Abin17_00980 [archaeon BMS3Abin17]|nr:hypothetical protein BMS3Abin17_00980 [archaeon BMS3Abin17]HDZ60068.1 hypothetical protein [Candidatus Pacearchaeota archaeon]
MDKEHFREYFLNKFSVIGIGGLILLAVIPTGLYKKILPHKVMDEKAVYQCFNEEESKKCDLREGSLPWRFSSKVKCDELDSSYQKTNKSYSLDLDKYECIKLTSN